MSINRSGKYVLTMGGKSITGVQALEAVGLDKSVLKGGSAPKWVESAMRTPGLSERFSAKGISLTWQDFGEASEPMPKLGATKSIPVEPAKPQASTWLEWDSLSIKDRVIKAGKAGLSGRVGAKNFAELTPEEKNALLKTEPISIPEKTYPVPPSDEALPEPITQFINGYNNLIDYIEDLQSEIQALQAKNEELLSTIDQLAK